MNNTVKLILKIAAALLAVSAVAFLLITQWDKITAAVNNVAEKLSLKKDSEADFYEEHDGAFFVTE
ncbi:MAG: hypothetical protein IKU12_03015 [Oscillospiraceae bacterium]|nr:hypothetical protein [Oscillospiraceae bacterium]